MLEHAAKFNANRKAVKNQLTGHVARSISLLYSVLLLHLLLVNQSSTLAENYDYRTPSSIHNQLTRPSVESPVINDTKNFNYKQQLTSNYGNNQSDNEPATTSIHADCCPCDEAKYELIFEGLWSKHTHPDEFPESESVAFFGDIIGASHSSEFRMWRLGAMASDGVKELAATGSTKRLESELKLASSRTRTIIKARELRQPTLNGKTSAVFRTDRRHHLVSILSKIGPSPDWMLGVSGLDLCQADCTWSSQRIINLFLWDAGVDSGINFTKSANPTIPQEPIGTYSRRNKDSSSNKLGVIVQSSGGQTYDGTTAKRSLASMQTNANDMTNNRNQYSFNDDYYPNQAKQQQPQSQSMASNSDPSFSLGESKPFARLTITRQRIYEKSCNHSDQPTTQSDKHPQTYPVTGDQEQEIYQNKKSTDSWSPDTVGSNRANSTSTTPITYTKGPPSTSDHRDSPINNCRYTKWSDWTSCSSTCGKGIRTRTRSLKNDRYAQSAACPMSGQVEREICLAVCLGGNPICYTRDWGPWSRCSVDCGQGRRKRARTIIEPQLSGCDGGVELDEEEPCIGMGDCSGGSGGAITKQPTSSAHSWSPLRNNKNNQQPAQLSPRYHERNNSADCQVSSWSAWTECSRHPCGGTRIRTRHYVNRASITKCKIQVIQKRQCPVNSELCRHNLEDETNSNNLIDKTNENNQTKTKPVTNCKLSRWSPWSNCTSSCGFGVRIQNRYVVQRPQHGGKACSKKLTRTMKCKNLPSCLDELMSSSR